MKRVIKAARYREEADKYVKWLGREAQLLADICNAAPDIDAVREIVNKDGNLWQKKRAESGNLTALIKGVAGEVADLAEQYHESDKKDKALPQVKEKVLSFLRSKGYPLTTTTNDWSDNEAYVIVPADEAEFKDLNRVCRELTDQFDLKWDTPLSGSWTGHNTSLDGVSFHVSIERDYKFDPSGKERSIQIYF